MKPKTLPELLNERDLHCLVERHLGGTGIDSGNFATLYTNLAGKLKAERFIVPVFGVQGSGKSTFLNALLFDRPVLPVEADETTCVPVEVVWASEPSGNARIIHHDHREKHVPADEDHLRAFVDNAVNPGNELGVSRVIVESDCELLKSGLVLVDLPGIGSLTTKNVETTQSYLQNSVGLIFMLRTVPPITQSDSIAIQLQWPRLPYAFFIQNQWNNESKREADEGRTHNVRVLREIAGRARVSLPPDGPAVHMVNAYAAWCGKLSRDGVAAKDSGVESVAGALREGICEWPRLLAQSISKKLELDLEKARESICRQIEDLSKTRAHLKEEMTEEKRRFDQYIRKVGEKMGTARQETESFRQKLHSIIEGYHSSIQKYLRNEMRTKMRGGIVDGPRLEIAMKDEQRVAFDEAVGIVHEKLSTFAYELKAKFETVESWDGQAAFRSNTVRKEEAKKWENILPPAGSAVGGIGGAIGGGIGGAALLAFLVSNPAGWAVTAAAVTGGAIVSLCGALFGNWLGDMGREAVLEKRIKHVEPQVFAAIEKFVVDVSGQLERNVTECIDEMVSALETWKSQQETAFLREKKQRLAAQQASEEEKRASTALLEKDLKDVNWYLSQVQLL